MREKFSPLRSSIGSSMVTSIGAKADIQDKLFSSYLHEVVIRELLITTKLTTQTFPLLKDKSGVYKVIIKKQP